MPPLSMRPMTSVEFGAVRDRLVSEYAAEKVATGEWAPATAEVRAADETDRLLPEGVDTPGARMLMAETAGGETVGFVWLALERHPGAGGGAWIYDIEVWPEFRSRGFGRSLLAAAEAEAAGQGVDSIGLNVFGTNLVARRLYESAGYVVAALQMTKPLR